MPKRQPELFDGAKKQDTINDLDCIRCGRWFPTFDRLAKHMYARHGPPTPATQTHDAWAKHSGIARVSVPYQGDSTVAKKSVAPTRRGNGAAPNKRSRGNGGIPAPSQSAQQSEYNPFIKASDIGDIDDAAALTLNGKVRVADSGFGEQVICEVRYDGSVYDWGFKVNGANHRLLFKRFGKDEKKWKGKVNVTIKEFNGNPYIAVDRD